VTRYTREQNVQIIISLLKAHGIRHVIASPGNTNTAFVGSIHKDPYFTVYSAVDERSAAYMACGLSEELGVPVVISCTGATASRNYLPGMTEAFYRKLPVLAITSSQNIAKVGHHSAQLIDRSVLPKDVAMLSVSLPIVREEDELWECEVKVNEALLALRHHGGGPVHINLPTTFTTPFDAKVIPDYRFIERITNSDNKPSLSGKIAIWIGSRKSWTEEEIHALELFCAVNNAVVFCDHTSGYKGKFGLQYSLVAAQEGHDFSEERPDILIHIGEISGDYYNMNLSPKKEVWRVNLDGKIRDSFRKLRYVFEMSELDFFKSYAKESNAFDKHTYLELCNEKLNELRAKIASLPFSNIWVASRLAHRIPDGSTIHFGILNSLRSWNFFSLPSSVTSTSNVGGFGIDGGLSSLVGASLANKDKLYFMVLGDLAFFYDMNILGNRHIGNNIRVILINNGKGTEFKQYNHHASYFGDDADMFIAASGHFGNKSSTLVKNYAENLGFKYITASNKEEFDKLAGIIICPEILDKPIIFEVFTDSETESDALRTILNLEGNVKGRVKSIAKDIFGESGVRTIKKMIRK